MARETRLFCSKPFEWFDISDFGGEKGDVYLCCPAWLRTPVGNVRHQPVDDVWNSAAAQDIRRSILDGSFEYCDRARCPFLQTVTGPVMPVERVRDERLLRVIADRQQILHDGPQAISCSYDKSCNLSCPSCRHDVIIETDAREQIADIQTRLNNELLRDARLLYITGSGDPFGSPFFFRLLRDLDLSMAPKLEEIQLQTNGQLFTARTWERIPSAVRALIRHVHISIDAATAETYAINRRGGVFERLLDNLEFISDLRRRGSLDWLMISMVVQQNNFREMRAFVELGRRFHADFIQFSTLLNWGTFTELDYLDRAVHRANHPRRPELLAVLEDPVFEQEDVYIGNLTEIRTTAALPRSGRRS